MEEKKFYRYVVNISFKQQITLCSEKTEPIAETVKTLKEAQNYKVLIDETVKKACVVDRTTNKIVEWWVRE